MNETDIQEALDELAKWVSLVEKNSPNGIWTDYNGKLFL